MKFYKIFYCVVSPYIPSSGHFFNLKIDHWMILGKFSAKCSEYPLCGNICIPLKATM